MGAFLSVVVVSALFGKTSAPHILLARETHPWLIQAGESIGMVHLGEQEAEVVAQLRNGGLQPTHEGLTAMGREWLIWKGKSGHELDVFSERGPHDSASHPEQFVRQVRVESPSFHTPEGFRVGSAPSSIPWKASEVKISNPSIRLLDCQAAGIAFELKRDPQSQWRCSAIVIHPKGRGVLEEYLAFPLYN